MDNPLVAALFSLAASVIRPAKATVPYHKGFWVSTGMFGEMVKNILIFFLTARFFLVNVMFIPAEDANTEPLRQQVQIAGYPLKRNHA